MSLYCAGSSYEDGIIDYELFYEHAHQFMAASFVPDGFDCLRDSFLGPYRTETNPLAVERGACFGSFEKGNNHCAVLQKRLTLAPGEAAQDAMTIPHSNPEGCKKRILQLMQGLTSSGYGLHLFDPAWFGPQPEKPAYKSPTVIPTPDRASIVHGLSDACADDALWLVAAVAEYVRETGELSLFDETVGYADSGEGTVYEHLKKILDFSAAQVGAHGICKGLRADWNDCLNLGGGESAMVSFLHVWALGHFVDAAWALGRSADAEHYESLRQSVIDTCEKELWDGAWYLRGITADGRKIGTHTDVEGRVHLESNTWAVLSGAADRERGLQAMDAVDQYLYTNFGLRLNAPSYTKPDDAIGFITRVYPGIKENGSIFSHPNPWAWCAEALLGRGGRAMKFYKALCPAAQNDKIEVRQSEPYSYCQFIMGPDHAAFGRARHPFMTGSGGWSYFAATRYLLGVRPRFGGLLVDPCVPADWKQFRITRVWRGAEYRITVENPDGVEKGVVSVACNGQAVDSLIPVQPRGSVNEVLVTMGRRDDI